jgi:hypothetical protein
MPNWLTVSVVQSIPKLFETDPEKIEKSGLHHPDSDSGHEMTKNLQVDLEALGDLDQEDLEVHQEQEDHLEDHPREDWEVLLLPLLQLNAVLIENFLEAFCIEM